MPYPVAKATVEMDGAYAMSGSMTGIGGIIAQARVGDRNVQLTGGGKVVFETDGPKQVDLAIQVTPSDGRPGITVDDDVSLSVIRIGDSGGGSGNLLEGKLDGTGFLDSPYTDESKGVTFSRDGGTVTVTKRDSAEAARRNPVDSEISTHVELKLPAGRYRFSSGSESENLKCGFIPIPNNTNDVYDVFTDDLFGDLEAVEAYEVYFSAHEGFTGTGTLTPGIFRVL